MINVILVDDKENLGDVYARNLAAELEDEFGELRFVRFHEPVGAMRYLRQPNNEVDLVVVDMLFPPEENPTAAEERHVARGLDVVRVATQRDAVVVGLSIGNLEKYPELESDARAAGVDLFKFRQAVADPTVYGWVRFGQDISHLLRLVHLRRSGGTEEDLVEEGDDEVSRPWALVFVALAEELDFLKQSWNLKNVAGGSVWTGELGPSGYPVRVLPAYGAGRVRAAVTVMHYLLTQDLDYLASIWSVGICGGFAESKVELGDIIVPDRLIDLGTRKLHGESSPEFRLEPAEVNEELLGFLRSGSFSNEVWMTSVSARPLYPPRVRPKLHLGEGLICADEVVASDGWRARLLDAWPKALGVDMESGGVSAAVRKSRVKVPFCVVRGVSDQADPLKSDTQWRHHSMNGVSLLLESAIPRVN